MNGFSWDNRIRRAELLANEYPASAEILRFYGQVARFQQGVYDRLKSRIPEALLPSCLERDYPPLLRLVQRIGPARLAEKASDLERNQPAFGELLAAGTSDDLLFFTRVLLQPFMEYTVRRSEEESQDHSARCPACGEWPLAAVLRGEGDGAKRWLICALCSREWEFRRIVCVFCGENDPTRLPVYRAAGIEHVRIDACDRCNTYTKAIDLTKNGLAVPCVDEMATIPLDLWAEENGYTKLRRNLLGL